MLRIFLGEPFNMYYRFDVFTWFKQQLPPLLRNRAIRAFLSSVSQSFRQTQDTLLDYCTGVERRLNHDSSTLLLQKWLNDSLGLPNGIIYITDYLTEQTYLNFAGETLSAVYLGYQGEGEEVFLSSELFSEYGGFIVRIPSTLSTPENIAIVNKWVEYYRTAGTVYKIESYE